MALPTLVYGIRLTDPHGRFLTAVPDWLRDWAQILGNCYRSRVAPAEHTPGGERLPGRETFREPIIVVHLNPRSTMPLLAIGFEVDEAAFHETVTWAIYDERWAVLMSMLGPQLQAALSALGRPRIHLLAVPEAS